MAEQIVFGADIDNVTIKNINGKLTAVVNVEDAEDEFEVVTDYVEPQEDDEFYVESVFAKFRHKATQLMTDAFKKEKKPRSTPVNESFVNPIVVDVFTQGNIIKVTPRDTFSKSSIDGYDITTSQLNGFDDKYFSTSDYPNAKAFNEANAGKTFTVTTFKRYAESEGHPVVKPTEIQVTYPTLKYVEGTGEAEIGYSAYYVTSEIGIGHVSGAVPAEFNTDPEIIEGFRKAVSELDASAITMHYELTTTDGQVITGDAPIDQTSLTNYSMISTDRSTIADYTSHTFKSEKWSLSPLTVEGFNFKLTISFKPYTEEAFDTQ